jgi:hypothetical protein
VEQEHRGPGRRKAPPAEGGPDREPEQAGLAHGPELGVRELGRPVERSPSLGQVMTLGERP